MGYWKAENKGEEFVSNTKVFEAKETIEDIQKLPIKDVPERGIRKETLEEFDVRVAVSTADGNTVEAVYFPSYNQKGKIVGYKKQDLTKDKSEKGHWSTIGAVTIHNKLFGQNQMEQIDRKRGNQTITEGEWDMLSCYQSMRDSVQGTKYADLKPYVVSIPMGTANAVEAIMCNIDYVKSFDSLTMFFDNDEATKKEKEKGIMRGFEAREAVANALLGSGLGLFVLTAKNGNKDASDMLQNGMGDVLAKMVQFDKRPYSAEKIVRASDISLEELIAPREEGIYCNEFPKLMDKIHGFRKRELVLLTSPSGVGKSTVVSKFSSSIMQQGERVGMIYLEETNKETLQRMIAAKLKVNYNKFKHNPLSVADLEDITKARQEIIDDDKLIMLGHFGSLPIEELMNKVRHMHFVEKCGYIFIDHLSVVISGSHIENERKELDIVMTELAAFCAANDVGIIAISHIKRLEASDLKPPKGKEDQPFWVRITKEMMRGSSALEQLSWIVLGLEPEILPTRQRGRVRLVSLKNRPWDALGEADTFTMDSESWEVILSASEDF